MGNYEGGGREEGRGRVARRLGIGRPPGPGRGTLSQPRFPRAAEPHLPPVSPFEGPGGSGVIPSRLPWSDHSDSFSDSLMVQELGAGQEAWPGGEELDSPPGGRGVGKLQPLASASCFLPWPVRHSTWSAPRNPGLPADGTERPGQQRGLGNPPE